MYVITGATGNTGRVVAETLLAKGETVRVIGRSSERVRPLVDKGAEAFVGSLDDASAMTRAFTGARAVYAMIPPPYAAENLRACQNQFGSALATAIADARVRHVVNLSSYGAHLSAHAGPVNGMHDQEQRLNRLDGVHVLHLRPAYFMENLFWNIGLIKQMGINGSPLKPDLPIPMIATRDVAVETAQRMMRLDFSGKSVRELLGERDLSMTEVTRIIGKAIGKENLSYVQFPYEEAEQAMLSLGLSPDAARALNEMYRSFNDGVMRPAEERSARNTTATSCEEFARHFAAVYSAGAST